jgi:hypothetical protein
MTCMSRLIDQGKGNLSWQIPGWAGAMGKGICPGTPCLARSPNNSRLREKSLLQARGRLGEKAGGAAFQ